MSIDITPERDRIPTLFDYNLVRDTPNEKFPNWKWLIIIAEVITNCLWLIEMLTLK
eukprot:Awhi_evm1s10979